MWIKKNKNEEEWENRVKDMKVGAVSPRIRLCDVDHNVKACVAATERAAEMGVNLLVFPKLTLTGATCRDL